MKLVGGPLDGKDVPMVGGRSRYQIMERNLGPLVLEPGVVGADATAEVCTYTVRVLYAEDRREALGKRSVTFLAHESLTDYDALLHLVTNHRGE